MRRLKAQAYFNHAGLGRPSLAIIERMRAAEIEYRDFLFSEAGVELYLSTARECRTAIARLLGLATPAGISLMGNATTAVQLVLTALGATLQPGDSIITSDQEHPCVVRPLNMLARRGAQVTEIGADAEESFLSRIDDEVRRRRPAFVILSQVSYKDGRILPVAAIGELLAHTAIPYIVDGSQALGHVPIDVPASRAWAYIFSSHKWLGGPWGTGGLWTSEHFAAHNRVTLSNWEDDRDPPSGGRYEGGTMSYATIVGLREACRDFAGHQATRFDMLTRLREQIITRLDGVYRLADSLWRDRHAPGIVTYLMPSGRDSWTLAEDLLEKYAVAIKPFRPPEVPDAIRISWSPATTAAEVDLLIRAIHAESDV
jgi:selenocysteine lyase/cysteine desulfurase